MRILFAMIEENCGKVKKDLERLAKMALTIRQQRNIRKAYLKEKGENKK